MDLPLHEGHVQGGGGQTNQRRKHVLDLDDFSREEIVGVLDLAEAMRELLGRSIKKAPSLRGKVVITVFLEPSTRTRVSFEQAGKMLSADVINVSGSGSSAEKGESLLNTALTLQAMRADLIVIRSPHSGAPYFLARNLERAGVVNAGDGRHAHPTQALLDLMTMRHHMGDLDGKKVVLVGDSLHSRVARSDIFGLTAMGASVVLSGPPTMIPLDLLKGGPLPASPADGGEDQKGPRGSRLRGNDGGKPPLSLSPADGGEDQTLSAGEGGGLRGSRLRGNDGGGGNDGGTRGNDGGGGNDGGTPNLTVEPDLDAAIEDADAVIALRVQKERQEAGMLPSMREYTRRWMISEARLRRAKPGALLMHPGPMNEGVEIASSLAHGPGAQIEEQVTNGVAIRMALLYQLLTGAQEEASE